MRYNLSTRSQELQEISKKKWNDRQSRSNTENHRDDIRLRRKPENWCKNQPKSMIKYINIQTSLCPKCQVNGSIKRCTNDHLTHFHNINTDSLETIISKIIEITKDQAKKKKNEENNRLSRKSIVRIADELIKPNLEKIKNFLA